MSLECRRDVGNIQRNDLSVNSRYMANVLSIHDQGNGSVENIVQENIPSVDGTLSTPLIPSDKHLESNLTNQAPLRLTGGGDTSFESLEEISLENQGNSPLENSISDSNCSNDILSFINQDNSMSEQDIRDVLFEAGYSIDAINEILTSKTGEWLDESASETLIDKSILSESESESGNNSAYDVLRELRMKNVNKVVIGSLNINSFASKFVQLREIIGKNLDILTIQETKLDPSFPSDQFALEGYSEPYRLDRNKYGGGC